jgi:hypothetical protein
MTLRWERSGTGSVSYFVDGEPVGSDESGFERVLDLVSASDEPLTLHVRELSLGGGGLADELPFAPRLDELRRRLGERKLLYELL